MGIPSISDRLHHPARQLRRLMAYSARSNDQVKPLFRVPPFPGATTPRLQALPPCSQVIADSEVDELIDQVRALKVGGTYWAAQPELPEPPYTLIRTSNPTARAVAAAAASEPVVLWADDCAISGDCDPWHMLSGAAHLVVDSRDELALIAALIGVPMQCVGDGLYYELASGRQSTIRDGFRAVAIDGGAYADPFTGELVPVSEAIDLCGFWRQLIDSNRGFAAAVGFGDWKKKTVAPLLWGGSGTPFDSGRRNFVAGDKVAIWKSRTPYRIMSDIESSGATMVEVEDGFIRSAGLGSDCVPPLSIVVDFSGIYFDPGSASDLEKLLAMGRFDRSLLERARALRERIVASGLSKYEAKKSSIASRASDRRHLLVPGQVEDDRSIFHGGGEVSTNLELLRRVRKAAPDAFITYKPHPDVEAGHRSGAIADKECLGLANEIVRGPSISGLIEAVDEVHVNTSLAGFEALLREKPVTTYGMPFYAGWGLTCDLAPVPARRNAKRSLDELVAAALLQYPRYLDPQTWLPCPPEILVRRLSEGAHPPKSLLVTLRRLQGRSRQWLSALRSSW